MMVTPDSDSWKEWMGAVFRRPAVVALIGLIAGIIVSSWYPGFFIFIAVFSVAGVALICQWIPLPQGIRWFPVLLLIFLVGGWRTNLVTLKADNELLASLESQVLPVNIRGTVARDLVVHAKGTSVVLDDVTYVEDNQEVPLSGKIYLKTYEKSLHLRFGDRIEVWGRISVPSGKRNPGGIDWVSVYRNQGVVGRVVPFSKGDITVIGSGGKPWISTQAIYPLRSLIKQQIHRWIPERSQGLVSAMTVGDWGALDPEFSEASRRSGTAHLVVISGFNVGIIALLLLRLFWLIRVPYPMQITLTLIGITLYAMITELNPPVVRAVIMAVILGGSFLFHRLWDSWNTLAAAAFFILLFRPQDLGDPSFQLSFAAVAAIVFFYPSFHRFLVQYRWFQQFRSIPILGKSLYQALLLAVCAQIGTLPILATQFHRVPTLGILATIVGAPLVVLIVPLSLIVIILGALGIPQAKWLGISVDYLSRIFQNLTQAISNLSFASLEVKNVDYLLIIGCFLLGYMLWHFRQRWAKWGIAFSIVLLVSATVWSSSESNIESACEVSFLDVGQGSSSVVRFGNGRSLIIDGGSVSEEWDAGKSVVVPCLKAYGIDTVDAIVLTHDDNDHVGGLISVVERFPVRRVFWNGLAGNSDTFTQFQEAVEGRGIALEKVQAGQLLPGFEEVPIWVYSPDSLYGLKGINDNNASVVVQVRVGEVTFLFPGDIQFLAESELLNYGELLHSQVLLIPHHGSAFSSSLSLLQTVKPEIAVISTGRRNPHGHPSSQVLERLASLPCDIERTDLEGAVVLRTDGKNIWKYSSWK